MKQKEYAPTVPADVAFIGLGVMGYPMAGHLARADTVLRFTTEQLPRQRSGRPNSRPHGEDASGSRSKCEVRLCLCRQ